MNKQIPTRDLQVRNVPDDVYEELAEAAKASGVSLSEFLRRELQGMTRRISMLEMFERIAGREPVEPVLSAAEIIRLDRDNR
jgi:antitoxin FitA